jgi:hypothetical protein
MWSREFMLNVREGAATLDCISSICIISFGVISFSSGISRLATADIVSGM